MLKISPELKAQFVSRFKSLLWRLGMMIVAFLVTFTVSNLNQLNLPGEVAVVAGLLLGEVSKFINNKLAESN
jgi:hypothetical protein